jgi:hypothetical protein
MLYEINFINFIQPYFQKAKIVLVFLNWFLKCLPQTHWMEFQTFIAQHVINMIQKLIIILDITPYKVPSTQYFISDLKIPQNERCGECLTKLKNYLTYNEPPKLLKLEYPYTTAMPPKRPAGFTTAKIIR